MGETLSDTPGGSITHTDMASEFQDRDIILVLSLEKHRLKPYGQGQFGRMENRSWLVV